MTRHTNTQFAVAVHVLTYLCGVGREEDRPVNSEELGASARTNPVYVRRVLGPLRAAGLVRSRPGAHGGWELAQDPRTITLARVWQVLQQSDPVLGVHGPDPHCPVGRGIQATLMTLERRVAAAIEEELAEHTVRDVVQSALSATVR